MLVKEYDLIKGEKMKAILIGSVGSSKLVLEEMINSKFPIEMVFSLDEAYSKNVSGYQPIHETAEENDIPYRKFKNINDIENVEIIKEINPNYIFVIGLSQLIGREIIEAAQNGVIGYHPTPLPKMRGRAAAAWQILLGIKESKCTLFFIDEGMDSGDIIGQEDYIIEDTDYIVDVGRKSKDALKSLLKKVLPQLLDNTIKPIVQNEDEATYLLKRAPEDGLIDWNQSAKKIQTLIRAVSKPYPGAYSKYRGKHKVIFWRADYIDNKKYIGLPGQIAFKTQDFIDIVCGDGLLRVYELQNEDNINLTVGHKFK